MWAPLLSICKRNEYENTLNHKQKAFNDNSDNLNSNSDFWEKQHKLSYILSVRGKRVARNTPILQITSGLMVGVVMKVLPFMTIGHPLMTIAC